MSNRILSGSLEKIVLARKTLLLIALLVVASGSVLWYMLERAGAPGVGQNCQTNQSLETKKIWGNDWAVEVELAKTGEQKVQGLSGRDCLNDASGMLFVYDLTGDYCYWMKDMNFAIDMVWLDDEQKVVTIKDKVAANTYPDTFCPDKPAQYVLEVPAGFAARVGWRVGTQFNL